MNPYTINPPESDVTFEKLCLASAETLHWSRSGLERFAKKGEEQFGVDIFDILGETPMYAAQCKLKEQGKSLQPGEINDEVDKAKTFPSKLDHYAILTTAGRFREKLNSPYRRSTSNTRAAGLFTVQLFTWEKITELIRQYPEIEQELLRRSPLRRSDDENVNSKLDYITKLTESASTSSTATEIDGLIDEARLRIYTNRCPDCSPTPEQDPANEGRRAKRLAPISHSDQPRCCQFDAW